jgi:protein-L-isoaspartate(D-aspartate) O-methyltransferase
MTEKHLAILRRHMVEMIEIHYELAADEIGRERMNERVRRAFLEVPRHLFVPSQLAVLAYQDTPLPIGFDKTVSQPFIAALMIDLLDCHADDRVLEVGTGFGYQAAILAALETRVWTVEVVEEFAREARVRLATVSLSDVAVRIGDGSRGWAEHAPFDRILVTAAAKEPPPALLQQLTSGGRMVIPIGPKDQVQQLTVVEKNEAGSIESRAIMPVRFTQLETA